MSELRDAIAGVVYRKVLARPDRFPPALGVIVNSHQRIWKTAGGKPEEKMGWDKSHKWREFVEALEKHSEQLPEWLAEDRD